TAPYGHNGAFATLDGIVRHHLDPDSSRAAWQEAEARLPRVPWLAAGDFAIRQDRIEMARQARALDIVPVALSDAEVADLLAFLESLTGAGVDRRPMGRPDRVPSGLPVD
ncbi:methylamine utilization protein MauG, partial [Mameliella sp. AT18]|nr:methylamine utilization protein MauG [Mameliella sp. AT18]